MAGDADQSAVDRTMYIYVAIATYTILIYLCHGQYYSIDRNRVLIMTGGITYILSYVINLCSYISTYMIKTTRNLQLISIMDTSIRLS